MFNPSHRPSVESPCVKLCRLDEDGQCSGCGRTLDEIAGWPRASETERARIVAASAARRAALARRPAA